MKKSSVGAISCNFKNYVRSTDKQSVPINRFIFQDFTKVPVLWYDNVLKDEFFTQYFRAHLATLKSPTFDGIDDIYGQSNTFVRQSNLLLHKLSDNKVQTSNKMFYQRPTIMFGQLKLNTYHFFGMKYHPGAGLKTKRKILFN